MSDAASATSPLPRMLRASEAKNSQFIATYAAFIHRHGWPLPDLYGESVIEGEFRVILTSTQGSDEGSVSSLIDRGAGCPAKNRLSLVSLAPLAHDRE